MSSEHTDMNRTDLIDVVATGSPQDESVQCADLWPVRVGIVFTQEDGPQGRGYSSAYCGILFKSLSLGGGKMPRSPQPRWLCYTELTHETQAL